VAPADAASGHPRRLRPVGVSERSRLPHPGHVPRVTATESVSYTCSGRCHLQKHANPVGPLQTSDGSKCQVCRRPNWSSACAKWTPSGRGGGPSRRAATQRGYLLFSPEWVNRRNRGLLKFETLGAERTSHVRVGCARSYVGDESFNASSRHQRRYDPPSTPISAHSLRTRQIAARFSALAAALFV
jgi:hypothetical protein